MKKVLTLNHWKRIHLEKIKKENKDRSSTDYRNTIDESKILLILFLKTIKQKDSY